jgi:hypothetical protein
VRTVLGSVGGEYSEAHMPLRIRESKLLSKAGLVYAVPCRKRPLVMAGGRLEQRGLGRYLDVGHSPIASELADDVIRLLIHAAFGGLLVRACAPTASDGNRCSVRGYMRRPPGLA